MGVTQLPAMPSALTSVVGDVTFFGTYTAQSVSNVYGLSGGQFVGATTGTLNPFRAAISIASGVKAYDIFLGDEATGINEELRVKNEESTTIFNVAGQRLSKAQKGLNIIGGKKILF